NAATVILFRDANSNNSYDGTSELLGTTTVSAGSWSIDASLSAGVHDIKAVQADSLGNLGAASSGLVVTVDTAAPTVSITDDEPLLTANIAGGTITYTFAFNEAVSGFDASDVTVSNATKGTFTSLNGSTYTLVLTPDANFTGNVTVDVAASVA